MARNRYGWEKRAKEMARKQKHDEKIKRRQGKVLTTPGAETPETADEGTSGLEEATLPEATPSESRHN